MAASRVRISSGQYSSATTVNLTGITQPAAGNLLLIVLAADKSTGTGGTPGAGFTEYVDQVGASVSIYAMWKIATGSGETSTSVTFGTAPTQGGSWFAVEYTDVDTATPLEGLNLPAYSDTARTSMALDPGAATADGLAVAFFAADTLSGAPATTNFEPTATGWPWVATYATSSAAPAAVAYAERSVTSGTNLASTTFTWTQSDQASGFAAIVRSASSGGSLAVTGAGTLSLTATAMTAAGTLARTGAGTTSFGGTPSATGSLAVTGSGTTSLTGAPRPAGMLAQTGSGTLTLAGAPHSAAALTVTGAGELSLAGLGFGTLALTGSGTLALTTVTFSARGTLAVAGSGLLTLAAATIAASGQLARSGSGALLLSGLPRLVGVLAVTGSGLLVMTGFGWIVVPWTVWSGTEWLETHPKVWDGTSWLDNIPVRTLI